MRKQLLARFFYAMALLLVCGAVEAQTITLQRLQPYGWQNVENGKTLDMGTVDLNTQSIEDGLRVVCDGVVATDVVVTLSGSENFSVATTVEESYVLISASFSSATEIEDQTAMTISAEGCESLNFTLTATAKNLSCATLADLKVKAAELNSYNIVMNYTGEALINAVNNGFVYLSDDSDEAIVAAGGDVSTLMPGQYVSFSCTGSTSFQYSWANFNKGEFTNLSKFELPVRHTVESLVEDDYGKLVLLKNATVTASEHQIMEFAGIVLSEYTSFTITGSDGTVYQGTISNADSPYFSEALPYTDGTTVDVVAVVHPYSSGMAMPSVSIIPLNIRPSVPEVVLPLGTWAGVGHNIMYDYEGETWSVEVTQDEDDPYRYHFNYLIPSYQGIQPPCYADLSADGKTLTFPTGWSAAQGNYFANLGQSTNETFDVQPKGTPLVADVDLETNKFVLRDAVGLVAYINYVEMFGSEEICDMLGLPYEGYSAAAGEEAGVVFSYVYPLPVVSDLSVVVEEGNAKLVWTAVEPYPGQEILGYRVYCNNDVVGETDVCEYVQENLRDGDYTYYVTVLVNEQESDKSNEVTVSIDTTGIDAADVSDDKDTVYTTLSGVRTQPGKPGIYIKTVGNKSVKMVVK